jgi:propionate CoA-transferase
MNLLDRARILAQFAHTGLAWLRHDTHYPSPVPDNPKFMTPREAAELIRDGDVLADSGLGGQQRSSIVYWAIREAFEQSGHPARLTVMNLGGHGGRGWVPGTLEELGQPGLCTRLITGHFETLHAMLELAKAGRCEFQCLPQGTMALLFDALGRGKDSLVSKTGVGTFLDPRVGRGCSVTWRASEELISVTGHQLRYRIPKVDVALFNAPGADRHGNIYVRNCAMIGESRELARAAKRNRGRVIANVGLLVDEGYDEVFLPAKMIDAVVYYPDTEQAGGIFHRHHWPVFTTASDITIEEGLARVRFVNSLTGLTPRRTAADEVLARLGAATLLGNVKKGAYVNIGVGLPEEVCRAVFETGALGDVTFLVESGAVGGLPAPGAYFGTALCPKRIISSADMFRLCYERLDATCLGALQVDSEGNVNVSKRGDGPSHYVGPGGFIDLTAAAHTIVFACAWMHGGEISVDNDKLNIVERGAPKFVKHVHEITFNGQHALRAGKRVFYVTHAGVFRLTRRGLELVKVMPGLDLRRDVLDFSRAKVLLPPSGRVPRVPRSVVTGDRFHPRARLSE